MPMSIRMPAASHSSRLSPELATLSEIVSSRTALGDVQPVIHDATNTCTLYLLLALTHARVSVSANAFGPRPIRLSRPIPNPWHLDGNLPIRPSIAAISKSEVYRKTLRSLSPLALGPIRRRQPGHSPLSCGM